MTAGYVGWIWNVSKLRILYFLSPKFGFNFLQETRIEEKDEMAGIWNLVNKIRIYGADEAYKIFHLIPLRFASFGMDNLKIYDTTNNIVNRVKRNVEIIGEKWERLI
jgi:hypothetical protein